MRKVKCKGQPWFFPILQAPAMPSPLMPQWKEIMHNLESVPPVYGDPPALEEEILTLWRETQAFEKLRKLRENAPLFRFVDGPIPANNPMGVHHAWGRALKDVFLRYKAMTGHSAKYQNGFDCQGLWVEVEVEKALGFNGKPDIERFGLA